MEQVSERLVLLERLILYCLKNLLQTGVKYLHDRDSEL